MMQKKFVLESVDYACATLESAGVSLESLVTERDKLRHELLQSVEIHRCAYSVFHAQAGFGWVPYVGSTLTV